MGGTLYLILIILLMSSFRSEGNYLFFLLTSLVFPMVTVLTASSQTDNRVLKVQFVSVKRWFFFCLIKQSILPSRLRYCVKRKAILAYVNSFISLHLYSIVLCLELDVSVYVHFE